MADLAQFDTLAQAQEEGIDVPIKAPDGSDTDIVIRVAGTDSARVRKARQKIADKYLRDRRRKALSSEELDERDLQLLSQAVISWTGVEFNGQALECTVENVDMVLRRLPFIREQVDAAVGDRAGFMKS